MTDPTPNTTAAAAQAAPSAPGAAASPTPPKPVMTDAQAANLKAEEDAAAEKKRLAVLAANAGRVVVVRKGEKVYLGLIVDVNEDGTFDVEYFLPSGTYTDLAAVKADPASGDGWYPPMWS